jgi:hypothetical protein
VPGVVEVANTTQILIGLAQRPMTITNVIPVGSEHIDTPRPS